MGMMGMPGQVGPSGQSGLVLSTGGPMGPPAMMSLQQHPSQLVALQQRDAGSGAEASSRQGQAGRQMGDQTDRQKMPAAVPRPRPG
jgi:hypothetical protein